MEFSGISDTLEKSVLYGLLEKGSESMIEKSLMVVKDLIWRLGNDNPLVLVMIIIALGGLLVELLIHSLFPNKGGN